MSLDPTRATFSRFGGLRLDEPVDEIGGTQALFLRDVDWGSALDILRPRDGFQKLKEAAATGDYTGIFPHSAFRMLAIKRISGESAKIVAIDAEGVEQKEANWTASVGKPCFARFGTPSASYTYARAGGVTGHPVVRFDGSAFSEPTATVNGSAGKAMPRGAFMVAWPDGGNRLVVANTGATGGPNGTTSSNSHVWFSDPGNAEAWHTTAPEANFLQLSPGDGEEITGMCVYEGQVFIFKETQFFVVQGVSVDPDEGGPVFDFRSVQLGQGTRIVRASQETLEESSDSICVTADSGVYFVSTDGVYVTTGGQPSKISHALRPLEEGREFNGPMAAFLDGATETCRWPAAGIITLGRRLYVKRYEYLFVYDFDTQAWTCWRMNSTSLAIWGALAGGNLNAEQTSPGTAENNAGTGTHAWTDVNNVKVKDTSNRARVELEASAQSSNYLIATNYALPMPENATPVGVKVDFLRNDTGGGGGVTIVDKIIQLVVGGVVSGENKSTGAAWNGNASFGGSSDLWGLGGALTPAVLTASGFGVAIAVGYSGNPLFGSSIALIDWIGITAYWTLPESQGSARPRLFASHGKHLYWTGPDAKEDAGLREQVWQSGFYDLGNVDEKTLTNVKMWGTGEVDLRVAEDFGDVGSPTTFSLGTGPEVGQDQKNKSQAATLFSHRLSGEGNWTVHRLSRYLREERGPGSKKP